MAIQHFIDDNWSEVSSPYYVSFVIEDSLLIEAIQKKKESPHIITYYDNKRIFLDTIHSDYTYIAKLDGETKNSVQIKQVIVGYDKNNEQVFSVYNPLGCEMIVDFPEEVISYSMGLHISGSGEAEITLCSLEAFSSPRIINKKQLALRNTDSKYIIITNTYPDKNNYYQNMFVHKRVLSYKKKGINVEVYRLNTDPGSVAYYEYEGIPVYLSGERELTRLLDNKSYKKILFHFINERMYRAVCASTAVNKPKLVWVHGYETTKWYRRWFNFYRDMSNMRMALKQSEDNQKQLDFLKKLYSEEENIKFIFVSNWYKEKVAEKDTNTFVKNATIIHNLIDDELFDYVEKPTEQRKRILTIRPFSSRTYANDLVVKAILELKKRDIFNDLIFDIYGEGPLFEEVVQPIRDLKNVNLHNYFLSQEEISKQHKSHGIFLGPSRMDSQGVSLGEAMSSGLVPVTNAICAIPEFIDDKCGYLADKEDFVGLANAIEHMYHNPKEFIKRSRTAAQRVRNQCGKNKMIESELLEITNL
ncbi:glycosyltransferase involved in cell wall biosynthesis [Metabacillus crassostreae]|uniref:glycosyltransferase family 4 protein n=1 Tax=Metabacillus crassostreae TaxID=929098 RepID=UPI00195A4D44|nr:glycosyltransferase family 4 protein [Metabacillus crassostreae]MBM7606266.1 glycosyltransferase involved in cell wall biosynthesis [Metabacillus crassostreae]